jgi:hypothetical protein
MRLKNKTAFEVGSWRAEAEFNSKLESIVRPPVDEEIRQRAHHQVGLIDRIHSILSVETMRAAAIILNELLILGDWAFGH